VRYVQNNEAMIIARYTIAVDRRNGKDEADFISCIAFGKSAEFADKYMKKGMEFVISGRIQTDSYTNKDGQKVYTTDVVVEAQEFCGTKSEGAQPNPHPEPRPDEGFMTIPEGIEGDLPFK
jgi:single-strand DNA-binding protein